MEGEVTTSHSEIPVLVLEGLEGNQPTELYGLQHYLMPYATELYLVWWGIFFITIFYLMYLGYTQKQP